MVRPVNFAFNSQTAVNNAFQVEGSGMQVQQKALDEFDNFVNKLKAHGIDIIVIDDTPEPHTPDSIFPNNWISFHENGTAVLYPMFAHNRRLERKPSIISRVKQEFGISRIIDFTTAEKNEQYLEGTGSMVLDRANKITYACLSPRTNKELLNKFCEMMHYKPVVFTAVDESGRQIYHTNVMMCVADKYVVICLDCIADEQERKLVESTIIGTGKEVVEISFDQVKRFAGNMLQVEGADGEFFLVMSTQAYQSLTTEQVNKLSGFNKIIHSPLSTIESNGGGSARCMIAEGSAR